MSCSNCGETDPSKFYANQSKCKACKNEIQRAYRANKAAAQKDPTLHDYGKAQVPDGYVLKGLSQKLDAEGNVTGQWVKTAPEKEEKEDQRQVMLEALREMLEPYKGTSEPAPAPENSASDLIGVIAIGDAHFGLRTHHDEVGEDFDLRTQEANMCAAVDALVDAAPECDEMLIVNVGDYLHSDTKTGKTTKGTPLPETDGSRMRVLVIALRAFRRTIDKAREKAQRVTVICCTGNHDGESSTWLRLCLAAFYENDPRVCIRVTSEPFQYHQFGRNAFATTHSDTCKVADLGIILATDQPELWASTEHRFWIIGHYHHDFVREMHGCIVTCYRTLAAADHWHKSAGYRSGRDLRLDVYHREYGHVQRFIIGIKRIQAIRRAA